MREQAFTPMELTTTARLLGLALGDGAAEAAFSPEEIGYAARALRLSIEQGPAESVAAEPAYPMGAMNNTGSAIPHQRARHDKVGYAPSGVQQVEEDEANSAEEDELIDNPGLEVLAATVVSDDGFRDFCRQIAKIPLLTREDEIDLAKRIEAGMFADEKLGSGERLDIQFRRDLAWIAEDGRRAKDKFIESNLRLVVSLARFYYSADVPIQDIVQEGIKGLIRAVEKFDYTRGRKFSTYASPWIRQFMSRGRQDMCRSMRMPAYVWERLSAIKATRAKMIAGLGRDPTHEELEAELIRAYDGIEKKLTFKPGDLAEALAANSRTESVQSIDQIPDDPRGGRSLEELTANRDAPDPQAIGAAALLQNFLAVLPPEEKLVFAHTVCAEGLELGGEVTHADLAKILGVSATTVGRIYVRAMSRARHPAYRGLLELLGSPPEWHMYAQCAGKDRTLFFPRSNDPTDGAKAICRLCSVSEKCLDASRDVRTASRLKQWYGIWGGMTDAERSASTKVEDGGRRVSEFIRRVTQQAELFVANVQWPEADRGWLNEVTPRLDNERQMQALFDGVSQPYGCFLGPPSRAGLALKSYLMGATVESLLEYTDMSGAANFIKKTARMAAYIRIAELRFSATPECRLSPERAVIFARRINEAAGGGMIIDPFNTTAQELHALTDQYDQSPPWANNDTLRGVMHAYLAGASRNDIIAHFGLSVSKPALDGFLARAVSRRLVELL